MTSILLIDDETTANEIGTMILQSLGYEVISKLDSHDALNTFKRRPQAFDLVITDYMMPVMKGNQLAKRMRFIRFDIPIILCTGHTYIQMSDLDKWGIDALVIKPYRLKEIARIVRQTLGKKKRHRQPAP